MKQQAGIGILFGAHQQFAGGGVANRNEAGAGGDGTSDRFTVS